MHQMVSGRDQVQQIQDAISESVLSFNREGGRGRRGGETKRLYQERKAKQGAGKAATSHLCSRWTKRQSSQAPL